MRLPPVGTRSPVSFRKPSSGATYLAAVVLILLVGVWAARVSERAFGRKDDGRIVIDEVVGQLIALMPLLFLGGIGVASSTARVGRCAAGDDPESFSFFSGS